VPNTVRSSGRCPRAQSIPGTVLCQVQLSFPLKPPLHPRYQTAISDVPQFLGASILRPQLPTQQDFKILTIQGEAAIKAVRCTRSISSRAPSTPASKASPHQTNLQCQRKHRRSSRLAAAPLRCQCSSSIRSCLPRRSSPARPGEHRTTDTRRHPAALQEPEAQERWVVGLGKPSPGLTQQPLPHLNRRDTLLRHSSPSGGLGSTELPGKCRGSGSAGQRCTPPAPSSARPCCGRTSGSRCSPSQRYRGTRAAGRRALLLPGCRSLRDREPPSPAWSEPQQERELRQAQQQQLCCAVG